MHGKYFIQCPLHGMFVKVSGLALIKIWALQENGRCFCLRRKQGGVSGKGKGIATPPANFCFYGQGVKIPASLYSLGWDHCWKLKFAVWNYSVTNIYSGCGVAWKKSLRRRQPTKKSTKILSRWCAEVETHVANNHKKKCSTSLIERNAN